MGKRIYTDAQREEAARLFAASTLGQESTVKYVAEQIGMSASTVRLLAASRGLTKTERKYQRYELSADEQQWLREVKAEPATTKNQSADSQSNCERCPMVKHAGGGRATTLCVSGGCLLGKNKQEVFAE